jgi:hypothetical protein
MEYEPILALTGLSLDFEARIWIRTRIRVKIRIRISINYKSNSGSVG